MWEDLFDSEVLYLHVPLASWNNTLNATSGSGAVGISPDGIAVNTGSTSGSDALARVQGRSSSTTKTPPYTWDRKRMFRVLATFEDATQQRGLVGMGRSWDNVFTEQHVGFYIENDTLYMSVADGTTQNTSSVQTFSAGDAFTLEAKFYPGDRAKFWVDGAKEGELTANLPSGTDYAQNMLSAYIHNTEAVGKIIDNINELWFLQLEA